MLRQRPGPAALRPDDPLRRDATDASLVAIVMVWARAPLLLPSASHLSPLGPCRGSGTREESRRHHEARDAAPTTTFCTVKISCLCLSYTMQIY